MKSKGTFSVLFLACFVAILSQFIEKSCEWLTFPSEVMILLGKKHRCLILNCKSNFVYGSIVTHWWGRRLVHEDTLAQYHMIRVK